MMTERCRIQEGDFSGNLLSAIVAVVASRLYSGLPHWWEFHSDRAHLAVRKVFEYLESMPEYDLEFYIAAGGSGTWSNMIAFEERVLTTLRRNLYEAPHEFEIHMPGDLRTRMQEDEAVGTEELWLKCAEIFIEVYQEPVMTKPRGQIHPVDFSGNLLRGIAWVAEEQDRPQLLTMLELDSRAAHRAVCDVYTYLESLCEYELMFDTTLSERWGVSHAWRKMIIDEERVLGTIYCIGHEFSIVIRSDLDTQMQREGSVGTFDLWLECTERFLKAYEEYRLA